MEVRNRRKAIFLTHTSANPNSVSQSLIGTNASSLLHLGQRNLGKVLVTGASGFLGAAVVARLRAHGAEVVASDIAESGIESAKIIRCDVTDFDEVEAVVRSGAFNTILHCGAVSGPMVFADRPLDIWRINVGGTVHVLEASRRFGVGRVVICSTSEVYGDCTCRVDEMTLPRPTTVYGASKLAAEQALAGYVSEHGLDAVALRLSWIYGPGRTTPTTLEKAIRAGVAGESATMDAGPETPTHYINIDDAVQGLLLAASVGNLKNQIYNITAGPAVPMAMVAQLLEQLSGGTTVNCEPATNSGRGISNIDNSRAARDLGFEITVSLSEGLARYHAALHRVRAGQ